MYVYRGDYDSFDKVMNELQAQEFLFILFLQQYIVFSLCLICWIIFFPSGTQANDRIEARGARKARETTRRIATSSHRAEAEGSRRQIEQERQQPV